MELSKIILVFFEGFASFISPCILPMLPIYMIYLFGNTSDKRKIIINTLGFILGFTIVFTTLGAGATSIGKLLQSNKMLLQRVSGAIIILFGLFYMDIIKIKFLNKQKRIDYAPTQNGFFKSIIFGAAFSFGWTPCLGVYLGSALMLASNSKTLAQGVFLLFVFSMGLGIPFLITSLAYEKIKPLLTWVKKHYKLVKTVSGVLLIIAGLSLLLNVFGYYAGLFN